MLHLVVGYTYSMDKTLVFGTRSDLMKYFYTFQHYSTSLPYSVIKFDLDFLHSDPVQTCTSIISAACVTQL